jgi:AraC family transcriptional regulator
VADLHVGMGVLSHRSHPGLNVYTERNLLSVQQLARWQGLPLCWVDASASVVRRSVISERPVLALLEAGEAQADFEYTQRRVHLDIAAGAMGLFLPRETRSSRWRCASARRVMIDLDPAALLSRGLDFDGELAGSLREDLEFRDGELAALLRAMTREVAAGCPNGRLYAESASLALLARLRARLGGGRKPVRERGRLTPAQLTQVTDHIDRQLAGDLSLAALASVVCLSAPHFARLFRNATGSSPHRHVLRMRVQRACELMQHTAMPLTAVAQACGFSSQSHMNEAVVAALGATPGEIRRAASPRSAGDETATRP